MLPWHKLAATKLQTMLISDLTVLLSGMGLTCDYGCPPPCLNTVIQVGFNLGGDLGLRLMGERGWYLPCNHRKKGPSIALDTQKATGTAPCCFHESHPKSNSQKKNHGQHKITAPATQNGGLDAHSHKRDKSTVTNDAPTFTLLYWQHCRHTAGTHSSQHSKFSLKI